MRIQLASKKTVPPYMKHISSKTSGSLRWFLALRNSKHEYLTLWIPTITEMWAGSSFFSKTLFPNQTASALWKYLKLVKSRGINVRLRKLGLSEERNNQKWRRNVCDGRWGSLCRWNEMNYIAPICILGRNVVPRIKCKSELSKCRYVCV